MKGYAWEEGELLRLGEMLDARPESFGNESVAVWMARSLLRVRDRSGLELPLRANAVQRAFELGRGRRNIVLKARQMGVTTWVSGMLFLRTVTRRGVLTVQVAQTREAAEGIFRMVQRFWECLPEELREKDLRLSRSNAGQMRFEEIDSEFRVLSASDANAGRGLSIQNLHCSELAHWPGDAAATLAGLRAALAPGGQMVLESTPNGAYGCFYDEWQSAEEKGLRRHFFPWWMEEEYVGPAVTGAMTEEELALVREHGLTAEQIGFRRGLEGEYRGLRTQEFAEDAATCFRATGESCFDVVAVERRMGQLRGPMETRQGGAMETWLPPVRGREYLLAVDTAGGGTDGDYAVVEVLELQTGLQCAELRRHLAARELAMEVVGMAREYGGALVAVERNNHGAGVLAYLAMGDEVRLYEHGGQAGWLTTAASKPGMVSRLGALLVEEPWLFESRRLLAECRSYVTLPGGGTGAAAGAHDDCVMAMAIGHAVRAELLATGRVGMARRRDSRGGWGGLGC